MKNNKNDADRKKREIVISFFPYPLDDFQRTHPRNTFPICKYVCVRIHKGYLTQYMEIQHVQCHKVHSPL